MHADGLRRLEDRGHRQGQNHRPSRSARETRLKQVGKDHAKSDDRKPATPKVPAIPCDQETSYVGNCLEAEAGEERNCTMNGDKAARMDVSPEELDIYLDLTAEQVSRIIL